MIFVLPIVLLMHICLLAYWVLMGLALTSVDGDKTNSVVPLKNTKPWLVRNGLPRMIGAFSLLCIFVSYLCAGGSVSRNLESNEKLDSPETVIAANLNVHLSLRKLAIKSLWTLPACTLVMLISGPGSPMPVFASLCAGSCVVISQRYLYFYLSGHQISELKNTDEGHTNTTRNGFHMSDVAMWWVLSSLSYFSTGHKSTFGSVHISAAFIGIDDFHFEVSGALLALNTWSGPLLHCLAIGSIFSHHSVTEYPSSISSARLMFATCSVSMLLFMMLCLIILRHHLFLWAVFAPKYVFLAATHTIYLFVLFMAEMCGILNHMICLLMMNSKNKHE